jgi:transcriptional regulator with XRE-family HTH domain
LPQESGKSTLGQRFLEIRKDYGYKQGEFAAFLRITQGMVSKIENDEAGISLEIIDPIITVLHISFDWLLHGDGPKYKGGGLSPSQEGTTWLRAGEIVTRAIDEKGIRPKLTEARIGLLVSLVARGLAESGPEGIGQRLAQLIDLIQARAKSTESE